MFFDETLNGLGRVAGIFEQIESARTAREVALINAGSMVQNAALNRPQNEDVFVETARPPSNTAPPIFSRVNQPLLIGGGFLLLTALVLKVAK